MKKVVIALVACMAMLLMISAAAMAHFGMVLPSKDIVSRPGNVTVDFLFWHPMENNGMDLAKPAEAGVFFQGRKISLLDRIKPVKRAGHTTWQVTYPIKKPGDYSFYMVPKPYWEPAEDCFIIHYTKVIVDAMAAETDWDTPVGLKMEIMPMTRPFGLYAGNIFTGQVLYKGKPLPGAEVEVEFNNPDGSRKPPTDLHVTQIVKADARGVFSFAMPWAGWWGFAALHTDDVKMKHQGKDKNVEVGGVIWVRTY